MVYVNLGDKDTHEKVRRTYKHLFTPLERDLLVCSGFTVDGFTACHKDLYFIEIQKWSNGTFQTCAALHPELAAWGATGLTLAEAIVMARRAIDTGEIMRLINP